MFEIRRVDELGRIVIPKEIRGAIGITEGALLIINSVEDDFVTFVKYNPNTFNGKKTLSDILKQAISEMAIYAAESEYETEFYEIMDEVSKLMDECKEIENRAEK